jgi:hypothetical protein
MEVLKIDSAPVAHITGEDDPEVAGILEIKMAKDSVILGIAATVPIEEVHRVLIENGVEVVVEEDWPTLDGEISEHC